MTKDAEATYYHKEIDKLRKEWFKKLPYREQKKIISQAKSVIRQLKEKCVTVVASPDYILELVIATQYYLKFGESPIQTAMKPPVQELEDASFAGTITAN